MTTDVLMKKSEFGNYMLDRLRILDDDVRFDICAGADYRAYKTMVHEVGHALGVTSRISNAEVYLWGGDVYLHNHPSNEIWPISMRHSTCTPFPLDVMAIYALYVIPRDE